MLPLSKKNRCEKPCTAGAAADTAPSITDFAVAEDQLAHLREAHGVETDTHHNPLWRLVDGAFRYRERRVKQAVRKKTYLWLCLLGMFGAHRFYAKQWITAVVYLLTCWTGFSFAMTLIDVMVVVPMKTDEKGILYL